MALLVSESGCTRLAPAYHDPINEKSEYVGHYFFTEQDQEGALDGSGLYIGFGHL